MQTVIEKHNLFVRRQTGWGYGRAERFMGEGEQKTCAV
jgi:hypothetical protein